MLSPKRLERNIGGEGDLRIANLSINTVNAKSLDYAKPNIFCIEKWCLYSEFLINHHNMWPRGQHSEYNSFGLWMKNNIYSNIYFIVPVGKSVYIKHVFYIFAEMQTCLWSFLEHRPTSKWKNPADFSPNFPLNLHRGIRREQWPSRFCQREDTQLVLVWR